MNIDDSVYWDADRNVGVEVNRGNSARVYNDVGVEIVSSYGEGFET